MVQVVRTDEVYEGESRSSLPDLFVVWRRDQAITGLASPAIGTVRDADPGYRSGNHVADGFYVLAGPSVERERSGLPLQIVDLAPTIAGVLGVQLPDARG